MLPLKALVLAGGQGTRLRPLVADLPKPMAPVGGRPFLEYIVRQLVEGGVPEIVLSVGYRADAIESHFGNGSRWGARISYSREEEPLGTGGALREALSLLTGDLFLFLNGDSFLDIDLRALCGAQRRWGGAGTLGLARLPDTGRYGRVELSPDGRVEGFAEKGPGGPGLINGGVACLSVSRLPALPPGAFSFETGVLPRLVREGLHGLVSDGFFIDIGIPGDYLAACRSPEKLAPRRPPEPDQGLPR